MTKPKSNRSKRRFGATEQLKSGRFRARYRHRGSRWTGPRTFAKESAAHGWLTEEERLIEWSEWTLPAKHPVKAESLDVSVDSMVDGWIKTTGSLAESSRNGKCTSV